MFGKQHKTIQWLGKEDLRWPKIVDTKTRIITIQDYFINTKEGLQGVHLILITLQWDLIFEMKGRHMQSMLKITKISNLTFAIVKNVIHILVVHLTCETWWKCLGCSLNCLRAICLLTTSFLFGDIIIFLVHQSTMKSLIDSGRIFEQHVCFGLIKKTF
jgi:hypothetical protein